MATAPQMTKPDFATHFLEGIENFNQRKFWEAHESWETIWLVAESDVEQYLQGLIQVAAAYHHIKRGTYRGALRLFDAALGRLEPFPMKHCGVDRTAVVAAALKHREWLMRPPEAAMPEDEYPKLLLVSRDAIAPPVVQW